MNNKIKAVVTILLLLFLYPIGLVLTWFWVDWPKSTKWLVTSPLLLAFLGVIALLILSLRGPNKAIVLDELNSQTNIMDPNERKNIDGQIKADISMLQSALELYRSDYQKYPDTLSQLSPEYINEIKVNPFTKKAYVYKIAQDGTYSIITTLTNGSTYSQFAPF